LETEKSSTSAFAGICVAILVIAAFIMVLLYYRNRVAGLKNVIHAHVQYGADPLTINQDRFHFDNPVYSFGQTSTTVGMVNEHQTLNNCQIKNNLTKSNNLAKAGCSSSLMDDSDSYGLPSTSSSSFKNMEADLNNPNIYHSLDDLKSENLYDEIEDKKLAAAEQEYDHLDYQRPNGTWKPHYQRMSTSLKAESKKNLNTE